jgi:hypothetical protein|tara:strand:- start:6365 stop:6667 length:303 start_codon:yes stop_codon:yes gene_type:complete
MMDNEWEGVELDSDIPIPTDVRGNRGSRYPWPIFKVGDSLFFVPDDNDDLPKRLKNRLDQSWRTHSKKQDPEWQFVSRMVVEPDPKTKKERSGVRVWRKA